MLTRDLIKISKTTYMTRLEKLKKSDMATAWMIHPERS
jgi:hypothetical protein